MSSGLPPPGTLVAIYARFSTSNQSYSSIVGQVAAARAFAERHGWIVVAVYEDAEKSGTTLVGRSGFFELMAAADRGAFSVIVVEDLSRLSRNAGHTHSMFDELQGLDIDICTVAGGRIVDDLEVTFGALNNKKAVQEAAYRTRRGQVTAVEAGRSSGRIAYGYEKVVTPDEVNGIRRKVPEKAANVLRLFQETAAGLSPNQICRNLNREGDPGPRGKGWRPGALVGAKGIGGGILRNRIYIGDNTWGRTEKKRRRGKVVQRRAPPSNLVRNRNDDLAIVPVELFNEVQQILASKNGKFFSHKRSEYVFSGKCRCAMCGESMIVLSGKLACTGRHVKGICENRRRIPREDVERTVLRGLSERLLQPDLIEPFLTEYRSEAERAATDFERRGAAGQVKLLEIEKQIAGLWPLVTDPTTATFAKQALMAQLDTLEAERQRLTHDAGRPPPVAPTTLNADAIVERLRTTLADLSVVLAGEERDAILARETVRSMVDRIIITPDIGGVPDGRGAGPVRLTVEGSLTRLLDLADVPVERDIKHRSGPQTGFDVANLRYSFFIDFEPEQPRLSEVLADLPAMARLLDTAQVPVRRAQFLAALESSEAVSLDEADRLDARLRAAQDYLLKRGLAHNINLGPLHSGWVWDDDPVTDAEWKERALRPASAGPPPRILRATPPEAFVVVISPSAPAGSDDSPSVEPPLPPGSPVRE